MALPGSPSAAQHLRQLSGGHDIRAEDLLPLLFGPDKERAVVWVHPECAAEEYSM